MFYSENSATAFGLSKSRQNYSLYTISQNKRWKWSASPLPHPQGALPNKEVGGGGAWTSHQVWRQNLGQGPAKFTKLEEKFGKFCHHKTQKLGKSPNFGVISEIQRAKFGVFVIYIYGGKIWGSNKSFRGKIWGQAPPNLLIWKYPPWALTNNFDRVDEI